MGAVSLGYGPDGKRIRRKVSSMTKQEVRAKLQPAGTRYSTRSPQITRNSLERAIRAC
jgi:hypothetical protein